MARPREEDHESEEDRMIRERVIPYYRARLRLPDPSHPDYAAESARVDAEHADAIVFLDTT